MTTEGMPSIQSVDLWPSRQTVRPNPRIIPFEVTIPMSQARAESIRYRRMATQPVTTALIRKLTPRSRASAMYSGTRMRCSKRSWCWLQRRS